MTVNVDLWGREEGVAMELFVSLCVIFGSRCKKKKKKRNNKEKDDYVQVCIQWCIYSESYD